MLLISLSAIFRKPYRLSPIRSACNLYTTYWGLLLLAISVFGYLDWDFYMLQNVFKIYGKNNATAQIEPAFVWIFNFCPYYLLFRTIIWGIALLAMMNSIKMYGASYKTTYFFLTVFYVFSFYKLRASLGTSLLFLGIAYYFYKRHQNKHVLNIIVSIALIVTSFFFHKSMVIAIGAMAIAFIIPLNRKTVIGSLLIFPILWNSLPIAMNMIPALQMGSGGMDMTVTSAGNYLEQEQREFNTTGLIRFFLTYIPMYWGLALLTYRIVFQKLKMPTVITYLYKYWYVMFYISSIFYGQNLSTWIYIRFITMALFPMALVMGYYYSHHKITFWMKFLASMAILSSLLDMYYPIYSRFIK